MVTVKIQHTFTHSLFLLNLINNILITVLLSWLRSLSAWEHPRRRHVCAFQGDPLAVWPILAGKPPFSRSSFDNFPISSSLYIPEEKTHLEFFQGGASWPRLDNVAFQVGLPCPSVSTPRSWWSANLPLLSYVDLKDDNTHGWGLSIWSTSGRLRRSRSC